MYEQHENAPQEQKIDLLLDELVALEEKLADSKAILKDYKIKSDKLDQLKVARKEMKDQIDEEKERIESKHYEDPTYERAKNDELTLKNQIKEKQGEIKGLASAKFKTPELKTENKVVRGEQLTLQFSFHPKVYLNGKVI